MAEIIPLPCCQVRAAPAPASPSESLRRWLGSLFRRRRRVGPADDLPDRLQRDMGLTPPADEPPRHYTGYLSRW